MDRMFISGMLSLFWLIALVSDLRHRRIPIVILLTLVAVSLIEQAWPWWILTSALVLWPGRRSISILAPVAIGVGVVLNAPIPALVLAAGALA